MHYSTQRIMDQVYNNGGAVYNDDIQILHGYVSGYEKADGQPEPLSMEDFQTTIPTTDVVLSFPEHLDEIFEDGAQLLIETYDSADDDGGSCYQAYILDPDWVQHYEAYLEHNQQLDRNIAMLRYISDNPEAFMIIWAGPY